MNRVWLVSALCLALLGCEEDDTVSATIGAEGGSLVSSDGKVTLQVPEGALASPTTFTIATSRDDPAGNLGRAYALGPSGRTFKYPLKLIMSYDEALPAGADPKELWVAVAQQGEWMPLMASSVDTKKREVAAEVSSFSVYSMLMYKLYKLMAAFGGDASGKKHPCLCETNIWKICCLQSGPKNPKLFNSWTTELSPGRCGCANADSYRLFECYENNAGYEFGGCTACERNCCKLAKAEFVAKDGECWCKPTPRGEECLKACKKKFKHLTTCELSRANKDELLNTLVAADLKGFCKLLKQVSQDKVTAKCAPALHALLTSCETKNVSGCTLSTKMFLACAMAIGKSGCPAPAVCARTCKGLGPSSDMGVRDASTTDGPTTGDLTERDGPTSPVNKDLVALRWNDGIKKEEVGLLNSKSGAFSVMGYAGDLQVWSGDAVVVGKNLYVTGRSSTSGTAPQKLYTVSLPGGKLTGTSTFSGGSHNLLSPDNKGRLIAMRYLNNKMDFGVVTAASAGYASIGATGLYSHSNNFVVNGATLHGWGRMSPNPNGTLPDFVYSWNLSNGKLVATGNLGVSAGITLAGVDSKGRLIAWRWSPGKHEFGVLDASTGKFTPIGTTGLVTTTNIRLMDSDHLFTFGKQSADPNNVLPMKLFSWNVLTGAQTTATKVSQTYFLAGVAP